MGLPGPLPRDGADIGRGGALRERGRAPGPAGGVADAGAPVRHPLLATPGPCLQRGDEPEAGRLLLPHRRDGSGAGPLACRWERLQPTPRLHLVVLRRCGCRPGGLLCDSRSPPSVLARPELFVLHKWPLLSHHLLDTGCGPEGRLEGVARGRLRGGDYPACGRLGGCRTRVLRAGRAPADRRPPGGRACPQPHPQVHPLSAAR
mmetsp:Transcript_66049/g.208724  ORF Transcript_66049/g.208724 Transcript_66049/m.208724 type:complete len:204 (+) Transcript_66049:276-887(+)